MILVFNSSQLVSVGRNFARREKVAKTLFRPSVALSEKFIIIQTIILFVDVYFLKSYLLYVCLVVGEVWRATLHDEDNITGFLQTCFEKEVAPSFLPQLMYPKVMIAALNGKKFAQLFNKVCDAYQYSK